MLQDDPQPPPIPREVRYGGDVFGTIRRFKNERGRFSCCGMSCGATILALVIAAIAIYWIWSHWH